MALTLDLSPETERRLRERATESGQPLEGYIQQLIERATRETSAPADVKENVKAMLQFRDQQGPTLGDDLTIRHLIEQGRRY